MTHPRTPDTRPDDTWEPEPLHVPAPWPAPGGADDEHAEHPASSPLPGSRVIVIDLA